MDFPDSIGNGAGERKALLAGFRGRWVFHGIKAELAK
jgi:hypothetical protein